MTTMYVCITEGAMDAEISANGLLVNIKLPQFWPVTINARTNGLAALN